MNNNVEIKVVIDPTQVDQVAALATFLNVVGGNLQDIKNLSVKDAEHVLHKVEHVLHKVENDDKDKGSDDDKDKGSDDDKDKGSDDDKDKGSDDDKDKGSDDPSTWTDAYMRTDKKPDELKKTCTELGIDFDAVDGLNTNAKLRRLILNYYKTGGGETVKETNADKDKGTDGDAPTIDEVRKAVQANAGEHRDAMKAELKRLGASNVTSLDESKYQEFLDFVELL